MVLIRVNNFVNYIFFDLADQRSDQYYLAKYPYWMLIIPAYLLICKKIGPFLMQNHKPFNLKNTILIYNLIQVSLSLYMFLEMLYLYLKLGYNIKCQPCDHSNTYWSNRVFNIGYIFYIAKITELIETVFFILRKKYNQASFLHLYHHSTMVFISWIGVRYIPGGNSAYIGIINSLVHTFMYLYYLIAALGPEYQKYLWWKKYITKMQMTQFLLVMFHNAQSLFHDCGYPKGTSVLYIPQAIFFYYLFNTFYKNAYQNQRLKSEAKDKSY